MGDWVSLCFFAVICMAGVVCVCVSGCCVKTAVQHPNGSQQKLFINICQSDRSVGCGSTMPCVCLRVVYLCVCASIRVHDMKQTSQDGGTNVSLPYVLGNPRPDKDHSKQTQHARGRAAVGHMTMGVCAS